MLASATMVHTSAMMSGIAEIDTPTLIQRTGSAPRTSGTSLMLCGDSVRDAAADGLRRTAIQRRTAMTTQTTTATQSKYQVSGSMRSALVPAALR